MRRHVGHVHIYWLLKVWLILRWQWRMLWYRHTPHTLPHAILSAAPTPHLISGELPTTITAISLPRYCQVPGWDPQQNMTKIHRSAVMCECEICVSKSEYDLYMCWSSNNAGQEKMHHCILIDRIFINKSWHQTLKGFSIDIPGAIGLKHPPPGQVMREQL